MMSREQTALLVDRFYGELWNRWDDAAVDEVLAEDFVFRGSLGAATTGRDGWRSYRDVVRAGSADFHNAILDLVCAGDRAAVRLTCTGTHTGPLLGLSASGRTFAYAVAAFLTAGNGHLTEAWALGDLESLRQQLQ